VEKKGNGHPAHHYQQAEDEEGPREETGENEDKADPDEGGRLEEGISPPEEPEGDLLPRSMLAMYQG